MLKRIVLETEEGGANALFDISIKAVDVFDGFPGINQTIAQ
jgi:hypothetical protein